MSLLGTPLDDLKSPNDIIDGSFYTPIHGVIHGKVEVIQVEDLESEFYLWHSKEINGDLEVVHMADLLTDFSIIFKTELTSSLHIWKYADLNCSFTIAESRDLQGKIGISPTALMWGKIEIQPAETVKRLYTPEKDTFVNEEVPNLNYGNYPTLKVGVDKRGYKYRSFLRFDISDIETFYFVKRAKLILYSQDSRGFKDFEISTSSQNYQEYSMVWGGQPPRDKVISTEQLAPNQWKYEFDVTELVRELWHPLPYLNNGFLLKAHDETVLDTLKLFYSRESFYPPQLYIECLDMDILLLNKSVLTGEFNTIALGEPKDLFGSFDIYRLNDEAILEGDFHLFNPDMLEGDITLGNSRDLTGSFYLWNSCELDGEFIVAEKGIPLELDGDIWVEYYDEENKRYYRFVKGDITVADSSYMTIDFTILHHGQVKCDITVVGVGNKDINGSFECMRGAEIPADFAVTALKNLEGSLTIWKHKDLDCNFYCSEACIVKSDINIAYKAETHGDLTVYKYKDVEGSFKVLPIKDLDGYVGVANKAEPLELQGDFRITALEQIEGEFFIPQTVIKGDFDVRAISKVEGDIYIAHSKYLQGDITVWQSCKIYGNFKVKARSFDDLDCDIGYVVGKIKRKGSYGFIM